MSEQPPQKVDFQPKAMTRQQKSDIELAESLELKPEFVTVVIKDFPAKAVDAIKEIADQDRMPMEHFIIYESLVALAGRGLDPAPDWRPKVRKTDR